MTDTKTYSNKNRINVIYRQTDSSRKDKRILDTSLFKSYTWGNTGDALTAIATLLACIKGKQDNKVITPEYVAEQGFVTSAKSTSNLSNISTLIYKFLPKRTDTMYSDKNGVYVTSYTSYSDFVSALYTGYATNVNKKGASRYGLICLDNTVCTTSSGDKIQYSADGNHMLAYTGVTTVSGVNGKYQLFLRDPNGTAVSYIGCHDGWNRLDTMKSAFQFGIIISSQSEDDNKIDDWTFYSNNYRIKNLPARTSGKRTNDSYAASNSDNASYNETTSEATSVSSTQSEGTTITPPANQTLGTYGTYEFDLSTTLGHTGNPYGFPKTTNQGAVQQEWIDAGAVHTNGFCTLDGRYLIACTTTWGNIGDDIDFYMSNGTVLTCTMIDAKSQSDDGANEWGHNQGQNVLEFTGNYSILGNNPYTALGLPSVISVIKAINYGTGGTAGTASTSGMNFTAVEIPIVKIEQKQISIPVKTTDTKYTGLTSKLQSAVSSAASAAATSSIKGLVSAIASGIAEVSKTTASTSKIASDTSTKSTGKTTNLLQYPALVESPYIEVTFGDYTIGSYKKNGKAVKFPNYMTGISVEKTNGTINQYTINLTYQIESGQDPNFIDKLIASVGYDKIKIVYGDSAIPGLLFREEQALITNCTSSVNFTSAQINYTISATSTITALSSSDATYPAVTAKPSDVIKSLIRNKTNGLVEIFPGMASMAKVLAKNLIASNDKAVSIPMKEGLDILSYLNYLVSYMSSQDSSGELNNSTYYLTIMNDENNEYGGAYFKITEVQKISSSYESASSTAVASEEIYEVDIGYPGNNFVMDFSLDTDQSWAIMYDYTGNLIEDNYAYNIDNKGNVTREFSPNVMTSAYYKRTTEANKNWWTQMTKFPVQAKLTLKGLVRPVMLMSYIKINAVFYGQKHSASGLYVVTAQNDTLNASGYRTELTLLRVDSD